MTRLIHFLLLMIVVPAIAGAAPAIIRGTAAGAEGQVIRAYRYDDLISFRKVLAARDTVDSQGNFTLAFDMDAPGYISLAVMFHQSELLIRGGETYGLEIKAFESPAGEGRPYSFTEPPYLGFNLNDPLSHPLNFAMDSLNILYDDHLLKNFRNLSRGIKDSSGDSLEIRLFGIQTEPDPFLKIAIRYRMAMLEDLMRSAGRERLFQRYLQNQPILYSHPDYMEFFNSFFSRYITHVSRRIPLGELAYRVNEERSYASVLDLLGRDSLLQAENFRELVLLRNLREMFYSPEFDPRAVLLILEKMRSTTRFPEHRRIADNLFFKLNHLRKSTPPPLMTFYDPQGEMVKLSAFSGKYLYIQFYVSGCTACLADRAAMDALHRRFGNDVAFLSVSVDTEPALFQADLKRESHEWPMAHFGGDFDMVEALDLRTFPTYLLLDRNGRVHSYPSRGPTDQAESAFLKLLSAERRED